MYLSKWSPVFAPEGEAGTGEAEAPRVPLNERPVDGPGSGRSELRGQLEKNFETDRKAGERTDGRTAAGKQARGRTLNNQEEPGEQREAGERQEQAGEQAGEQQEQQQQQPTTAAPEGWSKEAKAEWAKLPGPVQVAVAKRETDMAQGVEALKGKYADIDQVLQPRMDTIRRHGHTAAQAVNQLFAWFEALTAKPAEAFPALAKSFNFDLKKLAEGTAQPVQQQEQQQPLGEVSPQVQTFIDGLKAELTAFKQSVTSEFGTLKNSFAEQSFKKTEEGLFQWAKDKPHFEEVRQFMAHLIGSQAVPPLPNGNADLDKAYDMALHALPEVRQKVYAENEAKIKAAADKKAADERKAQQDRADKARRAGSGLGPSAPGAPADPLAKKAKGKTVKESLKEAMEEVGR